MSGDEAEGGQEVPEAQYAMKTPLAMFDPISGTLTKVCNNLIEGQAEDKGVEEQEKTEGGERDSVRNNHFLVHTEDGGSRLVSKGKWPVLVIKNPVDAADGMAAKEVLQSSQESMGAGEIEHVSETNGTVDKRGGWLEETVKGGRKGRPSCDA